MSARHALEARLVLEPVASPMGVRGRLTWELAVDQGVAAAGPAGAALLDLLGGVRVSCDYADPSRLLQVDVPAGWIDEISDAGPPVDHQELADADLQLVEALLGDEAATMLRSTTDGETLAWVEAKPTWDIVGRIALAHQMLADRDQPVGGLWALELAELLAELGGGAVADAYREELLAAAEPSLGLLPASLVDRALEEAAPLGHLLLVASRRAGRGLGPLSEALAARNADAAVEEAMRIVGEVAPAAAPGLRRPARPTPADDGPLHMGGEASIFHGALPQFRGAPAAPATSAELLVDHTARLLVAGATATVGPDQAGGETLTVRYNARLAAAAGPLARLDVLVTGRDGLVAASVSADEGADGFVVHLALPPSARGERLDVVVGRNLPIGPLEAYGFHERQAIHATRRAVDAARVAHGGAGAAPLVPRSFEADREWRAAGRPDQADALDGLAVQRPFVTEQTGRVLDVGRDLPAVRALPWEASQTTPIDVLSAARDLAWSLGDVEMAALIERQRYVRTGDAELPLASHDALTLAISGSSPQDARDLTLRLP